MTVFSSGGAWAATWRPLKPPHEMPNMPDGAGAPRLRRDPAQHLERVLLLLREVLVVEEAVGLAAAAEVDAQRPRSRGRRSRRGGAGRGERCRRPSGTGGTRGSRAPGRPRRPPAARCGRRAERRPDIGIQTWSILRTGARQVRDDLHRALRRSEELAGVLVERGGGAAAAGRAPIDLERAAEQSYGAHAGLLDRLDEAVGAHLRVVEELVEAAHLAGGHAAVGERVTAAPTESAAKPSSTARTCALRRSRSSGLAGVSLRVGGERVPSPNSSQTRSRWACSGRRARRTRPRTRAPGSTGRAPRAPRHAWRPPRAAPWPGGAAARPRLRVLSTSDRHEPLCLQGERCAQQRDLDFRRLSRHGRATRPLRTAPRAGPR